MDRYNRVLEGKIGQEFEISEGTRWEPRKINILTNDGRKNITIPKKFVLTAYMQGSSGFPSSAYYKYGFSDLSNDEHYMVSLVQDFVERFDDVTGNITYIEQWDVIIERVPRRKFTQLSWDKFNDLMPLTGRWMYGEPRKRREKKK